MEVRGGGASKCAVDATVSSRLKFVSFLLRMLFVSYKIAAGSGGGAGSAPIGVSVE